MALFNTTCKKATYLISKQEEGILSWREKLQLRSHLAICMVCRFFAIQTKQISEAARDIRSSETLSDQAKQKMEAELQTRIQSN